MKIRLWKLTDETNDNFYLANSAATIRDGLTEQIEYFVIPHFGLKLVFIDTFQKVRSPTGDSIYAADYGNFSALKSVADKHGLAMMVVHHTRKMADEDIMNTVSGPRGITGSADSIWVLKKASRGAGDATLTITGRVGSSGSLSWRLETADGTSSSARAKRNLRNARFRTAC